MRPISVLTSPHLADPSAMDQLLLRSEDSLRSSRNGCPASPVQCECVLMAANAVSATLADLREPTLTQPFEPPSHCLKLSSPPLRTYAAREKPSGCPRAFPAFTGTYPAEPWNTPGWDQTFWAVTQLLPY